MVVVIFVAAAGVGSSSAGAASPPANVSAPTIAGIPQQRQTLAALAGTWSPASPLSFTYQWQRCTSGYAAAVRADGAAAYWRLGEAAGSTALDSSGTGSDAHYAGNVALGVAGAIPGDSAVELHGGADAVVRNPYGPFPTTALTVEMWVKTTDVKNQGTLFSYAVPSDDNEFEIRDDRNLTIFRKSTGIATGIAVDDGRWHQVDVTWRGVDGLANVFVDGTQRATLTLARGTTIAGNGAVVLGQDQDTVGGGFEPWQAYIGALDDVSLYPVALSAAQVAAHYAAVVSGGSCVAVPDATRPTFTLAAEDVGTSFRVSVTAADADGATTATSPPTATVAAAPAPSPYPVRGIYQRDSSATGFDDEAALGFTYVDTGPSPTTLATLAARGLKGVVWLGGYSNATCTFNNSDDWIRSHVAAVAGNPGVGAYYIDDEPNAVRCPTAPLQMAARAALVKSIDPVPPTLIVDYKADQLKLWAAAVDVVGLDWYPCSLAYGCDYSKIDALAADADRLGIRYWGVVQSFGDSWYSLPTPDQLHQQFLHWRATNMQGYLVFAWRWPPDTPSLWLANHPELQTQLAAENAR